ncbi:phycobiliprotein lyase [Waterburya agarophytonicola K14]|uniref:Chromophore lyase CpcS/CpeS n=1 Tax=Waterburya agarophytonicola KI4 TaxID=2874699 RepID=A0A964FGT4_9CYAN|nr:phycobiliprotein lyase [Waterburya agarophytonicola]MCC0179305.1 phycobiliprotein lyase [Waterburya agarophytonicola KI4]
MDLKEFLNLSAGKWFSQRTNYFVGGEADNSKADITIELVNPEDIKAVELCKKHNLDPQLSLGGTIQSWDNSVDWGKPKQVGSATVVLVSNSDDDTKGKLIRPQDSKVCGHYVLGADEALTLTIKTDEMQAEERQWFASDNLRMRTTVVKFHDGRKQTSFYSEIRKAPPANNE